jgi:hypothetical protein
LLCSLARGLSPARRGGIARGGIGATRHTTLLRSDGRLAPWGPLHGRTRRQPLLVLARLRFLTLLDARLALGGAALALRFVEQRTLVVELLQRFAALGPHLLQAGRDHEATGTGPLAGAGARFHLRAFALDAGTLAGIVIGRSADRRRGRQQQRQQPSIT